MAAQSSYHPLPRSSTPNSPLLPPSPFPPIFTLDLGAFFRLGAIIFATISIGCLGASNHYTRSIIPVFIALGLSLLSQLVALACSYASQQLHVSIKWHGGGTWPTPARRSRPFVRTRVLGNILLGLALQVSGVVFLSHSRWVGPDVKAGVVFCLLTGVLHLIIAFLAAKHHDYLVHLTTAPASELNLEPKTPAVYSDLEPIPALDV
ncbi:hypothetical protein MMC11_005853 [Xylographa trunciseda]|nr:hypothetical protein [Xylographa trunciseda]